MTRTKRRGTGGATQKRCYLATNRTDEGDHSRKGSGTSEKVLSSAASPNQVFYNTKVDGEDNGPQRDGALRQTGRSSERCGG